MALGFWTGLREAQVEGIKNRQLSDRIEKEEERYQQGRADTIESQRLSNLTGLRGAVLPMILDRYKENKTQRDSISTQMNSLMGYNINKDTALALIKSGQAQTIIDDAKSEKGYLRPAFIADLEDKVIEIYGGGNSPEEIEERSKIILNGIKLVGNNFSDSNQQAAIYQAVFSTKTQEELLASLSDIPFVSPTFSAAPIDINYASSQPLALGTIKAIQRENKERMATILGSGAKVTGEGDDLVVQYKPSVIYGTDKAQELVSKVAEKVNYAQLNIRSLASNQNKIYKKVGQLVAGGYDHEFVMTYLNEGIGIKDGKLVLAGIPDRIDNAEPTVTVQPPFNFTDFNNSLD